MTAYLVEAYLPSVNASRRRDCACRLRGAAEALAHEGVAVRYVRSIFVPEDETCFHLFEASCRDAIGEVTKRAALTYERIVEAIE